MIVGTVPTNFSDFNASNFLQRILVYAFDPYVSIFGNLVWGIVFGIIGVALYAGSEENYLLVGGYLIMIGVIFALILPYAFVGIFGLVLAFIATSIVYKAFVESRN